VIAVLAIGFVVASWWPRRAPALLIPAAALEAIGAIAFAITA
jgi:hypothetical protein